MPMCPGKDVGREGTELVEEGLRGKVEAVTHDDRNRTDAKTLGLEKLVDEAWSLEATVGGHDEQQRGILWHVLVGSEYMAWSRQGGETLQEFPDQQGCAH